MQRIPVDCIFLRDKTGVPESFVVEDDTLSFQEMMCATTDGADHSMLKIGIEFVKTFAEAMAETEKYIPSARQRMAFTDRCWYSLSYDEKFIFEKIGTTIYAFGLSGRGFKHMPYHGRRILHIINDNMVEANKYKH